MFNKVLHTSSSSSLHAGHRVAAWEALCTLIDQTTKSQHEHVRDILWSAQIWNRSLELYLDQFSNARPKSCKTLLASLSNVLRRFEDAAWISDVKDELASKLVVAVNASDMQRDSKAQLLLFTHFLSKNILTLDSILFHVSVTNGTRASENKIEALLSSILQWLTRGDLGSIIGQLTSVVLDNVDKAASSPPKGTTLPSVPVWSRPLHETLDRDLENTEAYRAHIFPVLFKRGLAQYVAFLKQVGFDAMFSSQQAACRENDQEILYAALQTGKHLGLIEEFAGDEVVLESNRVLIPIQFIADLTLSGSRSARLAGLSLFVVSNSPTKPIQPAVFEQLKHALPHLHADTDAFSRSELFSLTQRLFDRIRCATAVLARTTSTGTLESMEQHKSFISWYTQFITWELRPTSSYQRHISALKCLSILLRSGVDGSISKVHLSKLASGASAWPFEMSIVDPGMHRLLLDLLMNSFEEVRQTSASILELCTSASGTNANSSKNVLDVAKERAIARMLASGRADHADGVAYIHGLSYVLAATPEDQKLVLTALLDKTEDMLSVADRGLARAVDKFPLHGLLTSLRYVLLRCDFSTGMYSQLHTRIERLLQHVWEVVQPTLCDDAPEGHVPDEMDEMPDISTKDILSYCWRALKETSLLMGTMLSSASLKACESPAEFKHSMFELCFTQLAMLRHRGAFSTVAQTWTTCCSLMDDNQGGPLGLSTWYDRTISLLRRSLAINTRRSAGLPSLICGVLIADRTGELFKRAFAETEQIAREDVDLESAHEASLTQVHAMNCMKDILKNTRLAGKSEQYVPVALRLAADSLRSEAWAIRNCGLMLFRAVIDRLLGTNDAYVEDEVATKRRVDFEHHQDLLQLVIGLLSTAPTSMSSGEGARNEGVFPALQLLQRAHMPEAKRTEVQEAVFALTASPSWHVRDKAARTYVSFIPVETTSAVLEQLLAGPRGDHNALHGALLCAMYLIRRLSTKVALRSASAQQLAVEEQRCNIIVSAAEWLRKDDSCLYTSIAFVDVELSLEALNKRVSNQREVSNAGFQYAIENSVIALEGDHVKAVSSEIGRLSETEAMSKIANQTESDQWLEDRALHIEQEAAKSSTIESTVMSHLQEWAGALQTTLSDGSIFSSQAAVKGLAHLNCVWPQLAQQPDNELLFQSLCLVVYDLLNHDDEEIRIEAAETASKIFSADSASGPGATLVPLVATQRLAELVIRRWPNSSVLFDAAVSRAFGSRTESVAQQLLLWEKAEYALFAEEKQNLYIDDVRETRMWAKVAIKLATTADAAESKSLAALSYWVKDGFVALKAKFEKDSDGPLGWTTDENSFLLGLRVVHAAELLLMLSGRGIVLPVNEAELRTLLKGVKDCGGNALWIREAERVLEGGGVGYTWESV